MIPDDRSRYPPGRTAALRPGRSLPLGIRPRRAHRRAGNRTRARRAARARHPRRPARRDVRLRLPGQPTGRRRPDARRHARGAPGARHHLRPRPQRGTGRHLGVGQPSRSAAWARRPTTASSASGTARGPASTGRPTRSGTPTCTASTHAGECCFWSATTRPPSPPPCLPSASARLAALGIPVLFPRNAREIVTMAMHGVAMSRASGCVVALKIVADVADGAWSVDGNDVDVDIVVPEVHWEGRPFVYRQRPMAAPADSLDAEADLYGPRAEVVRAYGAANDLDVIELDPPHATIGIAATGTTFDSVRQALADLGADDFALHRAGIRLLAHRHAHSAGARQGHRLCRRASTKSSSSRTRPRSSRPRCARSSTADGCARGSSARRTPTGRLLIPAGGELTAGRLLAPLRRVLSGRLELKKARRRR